MTDVQIAGERADLIQEAFRGMKARREADGWVSITGRLDPVPGEALMRALRATELELPRRIGSTRDEHRAAALDEIARQVELLVGRVPVDASADAPEDAAAQDSLPGIEPLLHNALTAPRVRGRVDTTRHPSRLQLVREPR